MAGHNQLGKEGESIACEFLIKKGYSIIERNWSVDKYELDIIAGIEDEIIFVEVKTRATDLLGNPAESVGKKKKKFIISAAEFYCHIKNVDKKPRFDIISVIKNDAYLEIDHIENAFGPYDFVG